MDSGYQNFTIYYYLNKKIFLMRMDRNLRGAVKFLRVTVCRSAEAVVILYFREYSISTITLLEMSLITFH